MESSTSETHEFADDDDLFDNRLATSVLSPHSNYAWKSWKAAGCSTAAEYLPGWIWDRRTGSIRTCSCRRRMSPLSGTATSPSGDAGTLGADYLAAIVARVNAYRWMAGLPGGITLDPAENAEDQQDALMTAANDQLNHFPPSTWIDYTAAGADAAAKSDLALGASGTSAIDLFMTDPGDNNTIVGHRRWILDPSTQTMGVGDIPGESDSLFVIQPQTTPVPAVTTVAWPPAGFVPAPLMPDRWSLQAPFGSDFSNATVTVTENGVAQQVEILSDSGQDYGGQAIVWDMPDAPAPQPGQQVVYAVQVDNVVINGQTQSFSYTTTSFDPTTTTVIDASSRRGRVRSDERDRGSDGRLDHHRCREQYEHRSAGFG